MQNAFRLLLGLAVAMPLFAQRNEDIIVELKGSPVMGVTVTSPSPELQSLANRAFDAHGAYRRVASGAGYNLTFTPAGATQVTVTITKGSAGTPVRSETVAGTSLRNALLRAADVAVNETSGLRGFFAGKLAFVGESTGKTEIYTSDLFFGEAQRWTSDGKQIMSPRWVPGGAKIVFTSYRTSFPDIYMLELNNRRISVLVSLKGTNSGGSFSPDGSRVAMVLSGEGNSEVYVANAQGRQIRRLTSTPNNVEASPTWSPDGSRLLYVSDVAGGPQLYIMPASGGAPSRVPTNISGYCAEPDWSEGNTNRIAFTAREGRGYQIGVYEFSSKASRIVTKAPTDAIEAVWMADGRHLVCTYRAANTRSLWLVDTESGKATRLSPTSLGNASGATYLAP